LKVFCIWLFSLSALSSCAAFSDSSSINTPTINGDMLSTQKSQEEKRKHLQRERFECYEEIINSRRKMLDTLLQSSTPHALSVLDFLEQDLKSAVPERYLNEISRLVIKMKSGTAITSREDVEKESEIFRRAPDVLPSEKSYKNMIELLISLSRSDSHQEAIDRGLFLFYQKLASDEPEIVFC